MARLSNSTVRTVRFYEETGVLQPAERSEGGHRLFHESELDKLLFVTDLRAAGLSLDEIKAMLAAKNGSSSGARAAGEVIAILQQNIQAMREKIATLTRLQDDFVRAAALLDGCRACHADPHFPASCGDCSVMADASVAAEAGCAALPRAVRVLWNVGGLSAAPEPVDAPPLGPAPAGGERSLPLAGRGPAGGA
jgi:MerR family transcriptional regulator, Zn(II)-responsive regulator of zntA